MTEEYILFIGQEANFGARTILIPKKEFLQVRNKEFLLLKRCSQKNIILNNVEIDNLLPQKFIRQGNVGTLEMEEYTEICEMLNNSAEGEDYYSDEKDDIWVSKSIRGWNIKGGTDFDHIRIYNNIISSEKYNITDSFLYIALDNISPFKTVAEMYETIYGIM
jgi:hypothetical protein